MSARFYSLAAVAKGVDLFVAIRDNRPVCIGYGNKWAKTSPLVDQNALAPRLLGAGCGVLPCSLSMGLDKRRKQYRTRSPPLPHH